MPFNISKKSKKTKKAQPMMPWKVSKKHTRPATGPFSAAVSRANALEQVRHKAAMRTIAKLGAKFRAKKAKAKKYDDSWSRGMSRGSRRRYK